MAEKLVELIKDEGKIVTIPFFASYAKISHHEAKEMVENLIKENNEAEHLQITYILIGRKKGECLTSILLVQHNDLQNAKSLFDDGVEQAVFSIQRANIIDYNVVALVDSYIQSTNEPIPGTIIGKNCIKRVLNKKVLPALPPATIKGKSTIFTKQNVAEIKKEKSEDGKENGTNFNDKTKNNQQSNPIANMFSKNKTVKEEIKSEKKVNGNDNKKNTIMNMFAAKKEKETPKKEIKVQSELAQSKSKSDLFDSDTDEEILKDLDLNEEVIKKESPRKVASVKKDQQKDASRSNPKKRRGKNNADSNKKRRRIIVEENDSDSDIFGSEKSDNESFHERTDEEPEKVKVVQTPLPPKNKKRKAVDKTYEDEDGFIVTETEFVFETASEDEDEKKSEKINEEPQVTVKKEASPSKGKGKGKKAIQKKGMAGNQTSLMNFFTRK